MSILWSIWSYDSDLIKCVCPSYGQSEHDSDLIKCVCPSYSQSDHMTVTWSSVYVHLMVNLIIWQWLDQVCMSILWSIWSYDSDLIKCVCPSYGQSDHGSDLIKCVCPSYGQSDHGSNLIKCVCPSYDQYDHDSDLIKCVCPSYGQSDHMTVTWSSVYVHLMVNLIIWQWLDQVCMSIEIGRGI